MAEKHIGEDALQNLQIDVNGYQKKHLDTIRATAHMLAERARTEEMQNLEKEAKAFVQAVVAKTVELDPSQIDAKLIEQAAHMVHTERAKTA